jgi:hypothetical protein
MEIEIYDLDGTVIDSSHRYRTITENGKTRIDLEYWRANEYRAMDDGLLPLANQYMESLADKNKYVIVATARVMNEPDWQFMREVIGMPNYFISRKPGDSQSGKTLKIKGLQKLANLKQFNMSKAVFYEDNMEYLKAVCDHFNMRGVYIPSVQGH